MIKNSSKVLTKKKRQKKSVFFRFLFYLMLVSFFGVVIYVLFFSPMLLISSIRIEGNENVRGESINKILNDEISGKYLGILEKRNILFLRTRKIEKEILEEFQELREVKIKRNFPEELEVEILERISNLLFCEEKKCFILDESGEAYKEIELHFLEKENEIINELIIFSDRSGKIFSLKEFILEPEYINYIKRIKKEFFEYLEIELEKSFWTPNIISNDIRGRSLEGWDIYLNKDIELEKQIKILKIFLESKIETDQRKDLEYIDLRINNKIYYKLKNNSLEDFDLEKNVSEKKEKDKDKD